MEIQKFKKRRADQSGFGLLEIAIGLTIAASVAAAAMLFFQDANNASKTSKTLNQIGAIQSTVYRIYANKPTYQNVSDSELASSGMLPSSMVEGSELRSAFGSRIVVDSISPFNEFRIHLRDIPTAPCLTLVTQDLGRGVAEISGPNNVVRGRPMTLSEADTSCNYDDRVSLRWDMK